MVAIQGNFCIDRYEATNTELKQYVELFGNSCSGNECIERIDPTYAFWKETVSLYKDNQGVWKIINGRDNHPAMPVTWYGAKEFCSWKNKRLCTTKEWIAACSGPNGFAYPYGNSESAGACNTDGVNRITWAVGSKSSCEGGYPRLMDMIGNVWEWTSDCQDKWSVHGKSCKVMGNGTGSSLFTCKNGMPNPVLYGTVFSGYGPIGVRCCR